MRRGVAFSLLLGGCGPVWLGDEQVVGLDASALGRLDSATPQRLDAAASPSVRVTVLATSECGCFELSVDALGGTAPYAFEWHDGSKLSRRQVCVPELGGQHAVVARDALGATSAPHELELALDDASCPAARPLCLQNPSFEGVPAVNTGVPTSFDAAPWSVCTNPSVSNTPEVLNDTIPQVIAEVPKASDGSTYLGLTEQEQAGQMLCEALAGGDEVSLQLDVSRIYLGAGVVPDAERVFLELWGGVAADCSQRELLWASPAAGDAWQTYCVTLRPQQYTDYLTLRARTDEALPTPMYLIVDHLVPVAQCP